jgi:hypothetical protein
MMNSGEPITGIDNRPLNKAGMLMCWKSFAFSLLGKKDSAEAKDARHHPKKAMTDPCASPHLSMMDPRKR